MYTKIQYKQREDGTTANIFYYRRRREVYTKIPGQRYRQREDDMYNTS